MPDRAPTETRNLDIYGDPALPWSRAADALDATPPEEKLTWFLTTVLPDGRPHSAGVGGFWHRGELYFTSGPGTRKSRNLARNAAATVSVKLEGIDLVFEGDARRTTEPDALEAVARLGREGGWPAEVEGDAITAPFSAPSAGRPPWHVYRFAYETVYGVATEEPNGATRWRFSR